MEVPITQFRKKIFAMVNEALEGSEVWITHKGRRLRIVPESGVPDKLSRITDLEILNPPDFDMNDPSFKARWLAEMKGEWEKDWDRDFGPSIGTTPESNNGSNEP
jgi:antitoxin (DNA-binding transcriptional repressor) of toxin-antitoxin stability system